MADESDDAIYVDIIPRLQRRMPMRLPRSYRRSSKTSAKISKTSARTWARASRMLTSAPASKTPSVQIRCAILAGRRARYSPRSSALAFRMRPAVLADTSANHFEMLLVAILSIVSETRSARSPTRLRRSSRTTSGGIGGLNTLLGGNVPVLDQAQSLLDRFNDTKNTIQETVGSTKEMAELFGGGALLEKAGKFGGLIGPLAATTTFLSATDPDHFGKDLDRLWGGVENFDPGQILKSSGMLGFDSLKDNPLNLWGKIPYPWEDATKRPPKPSGQIFAGPDGRMTATGGQGHSWDNDQWFFPGQPDPNPAMDRARSGGGGGGANVQAQQATVEAGAATITAGSLSLGGLSLSSLGGPSSINPKMHTDRGWATGGILPGDSPGHDNMLGSVLGKPIGLEGGEFVVNPAATQGNLSLLQAINSGDLSMPHFDAGGGPPPLRFPGIGSVLGGSQKPGGGQPGDIHGQGGVKGQQPGGVQGQQPGGVTNAPAQPPKDAGEPAPPQTTIPQGQGSGFNLSGGALGAAESAASSAIPFGGGAAAQIGFQEANRAISYGVQAASTLAVEAPLDTFWLSDSGLSDPSHSWFGKVGLGLVGAHGSITNQAGLTQPPLSPGQGQQGSPLGGQQGQQGGGVNINIQNQHNASDVDHMGNNQTLAANVAANSTYSNNSWGYG